MKEPTIPPTREALRKTGMLMIPAGILVIIIGWITGIIYGVLFIIGLALIIDGSRRILKSRKTSRASSHQP